MLKRGRSESVASGSTKDVNAPDPRAKTETGVDHDFLEGLSEEQVFIAQVLNGLRSSVRNFRKKKILPRIPKHAFPLYKEFTTKPFELLSPFRFEDYFQCTYFEFRSLINMKTKTSLYRSLNLLTGTKEVVVKMKDFAPSVFADIRKKCGITTKQYLKEWDFLKSEIPQPKLGSGRSGSLFISSRGKGFVFKTIPMFEVETLVEILPHLHKHYVDNPDTRIIRFLGLHRYKNQHNEKIYAVVMNNVLFHPEYPIDVKYDLKGRLPKPGKEGRLAKSEDFEEEKKKYCD